MLQLLFYTERLAELQGFEPKEMHVLLGSWERQSFRPQEFAAYYRRVRGRLEAFVADPPATTALPVSHCGICSFKPLCDAYWDAVDHLSRVAGHPQRSRSRSSPPPASHARRARQRADRAGPDRDQRRGLGEDPRAGGAAAFRAHDRRRHRRVLPPQPGTGFALLPEPVDGRPLLRLRGQPVLGLDGSLEYLWGILDVEHDFKPLHAHDHASERLAFETFIDLVHERLAQHPDMHVYHYAQYEITALKRLMGRYGTREQELDDLLRRGVFVDLLQASCATASGPRVPATA